jgi:hypothetical protein
VIRIWGPLALCATGGLCAAALLAGPSTAAEYPIPVQGKRASTGSVKGKVTVRLPNKQTSVPLQSGASVPNGSQINATNGTVVLVVKQQGKRRKVSITGGEFAFTQNKATGKAVFTLSLPLTGCSSFRSAPDRRAVAAQRAKHRPRKHRGPTTRQITVTDSGGNFGSLGQYVATSTEGTRWRTVDACGLTTVTVFVGHVRIMNLVTGAQVTLGPGQHYTARHK